MSLYKITEKKLYQMNYSKNTIITYLYYVDEFTSKIRKHHSRINSKDIQEYVDNYNFSSISKQNQVISALKFMWEKGLGKKYIKIDFTRPRKEKKLPRVIDKNFLLSKISSIENKKHKAILSLAYSVGLRVSEVVNLKVSDIDSVRGIINIRQAKGFKDRVVPLSPSLLTILRDYYKEYHPKDYLFNGQSSPMYSVSSCGKLVKNYLGDDKHFHLLRHSSFTSMLEGGTDLRTIQSIAGHQNIATTQIYLHVSTQHLKQAVLPI
jgi:integrase/recombinase XerD